MWGMEPIKLTPGIESACSSTVKGRPATVKVPERPLDVAATLKLKLPLPVPPGLPLRVTHGMLLVTLHVHADAVVMVTVPLPPAAGKTCPPGLSAYVHPAWFTITGIPA